MTPTPALATVAAKRGGRRLLTIAAPAAALATFVAGGLIGLYRYVDSYWLYRGFPPPHDPTFVKQEGSFQTIAVRSPAVGGRSQRVVVYLPPGYERTAPQRYPVLYLLHGFPGDPDGFVRTIRVGVVEDTLLAKQQLNACLTEDLSGGATTGCGGLGRLLRKEHRLPNFLEIIDLEESLTAK